MLEPIQVHVSRQKTMGKKCYFCQVERPSMVVIEVGVNPAIYTDQGCLDQFVEFYHLFKTGREERVLM